MKDFVSKLTFGFLMAQLVPGLITVYSLTFIYATYSGDALGTVVDAARAAVDLWSASVVRQLVFLALSVGAGMAIHGLHWAVLGHLESHYDRKVSETFWHDKRMIWQILLGPAKILREIFEFVFFANDVGRVAIEENVAEIDKDKMDAFQFIQDFYLHFAQFYAHTSYALVGAFVAVGVSGFVLRLSWGYFMLLLSIWIASGFFFIIGRIQLTSLFNAENSLKRIPDHVSRPSP
jgi:hypothetical protein